MPQLIASAEPSIPGQALDGGAWPSTSIIEPGTSVISLPTAQTQVVIVDYVTHWRYARSRIGSGSPTSTSTYTSILIRDPRIVTSTTNCTLWERSTATSSTTVWTSDVGLWNAVASTSGNVHAHCLPLPTEQRLREQQRCVRERERKLRNARKPLVRSVNLFTRMFGEHPIRLFLNGRAIEVSGELYDYRISKKAANLLSHTANPRSSIIPYVLEIYDKQGNLLCNGCTVFKDTPVVDQIVALILHIKHGQERHLLANTNFFNLTPAYIEQPIRENAYA